MWNGVSENLLARLKAHPQVAARIADLEAGVMAGALTPSAAARALLRAFLEHSEDGCAQDVRILWSAVMRRLRELGGYQFSPSNSKCARGCAQAGQAPGASSPS